MSTNSHDPSSTGLCTTFPFPFVLFPINDAVQIRSRFWSHISAEQQKIFPIIYIPCPPSAAAHSTQPKAVLFVLSPCLRLTEGRSRNTGNPLEMWIVSLQSSRKDKPAWHCQILLKGTWASSSHLSYSFPACDSGRKEAPRFPVPHSHGISWDRQNLPGAEDQHKALTRTQECGQGWISRNLLLGANLPTHWWELGQRPHQWKWEFWHIPRMIPVLGRAAPAPVGAQVTAWWHQGHNKNLPGGSSSAGSFCPHQRSPWRPQKVPSKQKDARFHCQLHNCRHISFHCTSDLPICQDFKNTNESSIPVILLTAYGVDKALWTRPQPPKHVRKHDWSELRRKVDFVCLKPERLLKALHHNPAANHCGTLQNPSDFKRKTLLICHSQLTPKAATQVFFLIVTQFSVNTF